MLFSGSVINMTFGYNGSSRKFMGTKAWLGEKTNAESQGRLWPANASACWSWTEEPVAEDCLTVLWVSPLMGVKTAVSSPTARVKHLGRVWGKRNHIGNKKENKIRNNRMKGLSLYNMKLYVENMLWAEVSAIVYGSEKTREKLGDRPCFKKETTKDQELKI